MPKKGENIYKRKDNRWEARYVKGYSFNRKILYGYCYGKTYREAKEKVNVIKAALINSQVIPKNNRVCLSVICDQWLHVNRNKVKESSYVKYCANIEKHIKPEIGGYSIQAISSIVIEQFCDNLLTEKSLAPKTVRDILSQLKSILQFEHKSTPGADPVEIVYPKVQKQEMRVLSREEQRLFVQYLCPFLVFLGEAAVVRLLLQGVCKHQIHSAEAVTVDDFLRAIVKDIIVIVICNRSLDGSSAVAVLPIAVPPVLHLVVGDGVFQRPAIKGLMLCHRDHFLVLDPTSA